MQLAVISDSHFISDRSASVGSRRAGIADLLLLRAVHRLNRFLKPDLVVLLGDLVNDGTAPGAAAEFSRLRSIVDLIECPVIAIPGNHDAAPDTFYSFFERPQGMVDIAGVRFLPFVDMEEPGYNARREEHNIARMRAARQGWDGPIVSLQHVPLFPPGTHPCPYNYTNVTDIRRAMHECGINVAIGGHYHAGFDCVRDEQATYIAAPALCEAPFPFLMIELQQGSQPVVKRHRLAMSPELGLTDVHIHTGLAYCNENMDVSTSLSLAADMGLAGLRVTEHSGHLYFDRRGYGTCPEVGIAGAIEEYNRIDDYNQVLAQGGCPEPWRGIEIDCCYDGAPLIRPQDAAAFPFRIGSMHQMAGLVAGETAPDKLADEFLSTLSRFLKTDIQVLAHPFRVFRRGGQPTPPDIIAPTVKLLREAGVAAEINFHTNDPDPAFGRMCIEAGVPLAFGSDAHNLYEVGEFFPHLQLLRQAGYDGDPRDIMIDFPDEECMLFPS